MSNIISKNREEFLKSCTSGKKWMEFIKYIIWINNKLQAIKMQYFIVIMMQFLLIPSTLNISWD